MEPYVFLLIFGVATFLGCLPGYCFKKKIYLEDDEITISNNIFGLEKVLVNEKEIVNKFCFAGRHTFDLKDAKCEVDFFMRWSGLACGITFRKDGRIIYSDK